MAQRYLLNRLHLLRITGYAPVVQLQGATCNRLAWYFTGKKDPLHIDGPGEGQLLECPVLIAHHCPQRTEDQSVGGVVWQLALTRDIHPKIGLTQLVRVNQSSGPAFPVDAHQVRIYLVSCIATWRMDDRRSHKCQ